LSTENSNFFIYQLKKSGKILFAMQAPLPQKALDFLFTNLHQKIAASALADLYNRNHRYNQCFSKTQKAYN